MVFLFLDWHCKKIKEGAFVVISVTVSYNELLRFVQKKIKQYFE